MPGRSPFWNHFWMFWKWGEWWYPATMGFPTKNDHFGVWNGGTAIYGNTQIQVLKALLFMGAFNALLHKNNTWKQHPIQKCRSFRCTFPNQKPPSLYGWRWKAWSATIRHAPEILTNWYYTKNGWFSWNMDLDPASNMSIFGIYSSNFREVLLMEEILHQVIWKISHYLLGFIHPRWLFGFLPSTVSLKWKGPDIFKILVSFAVEVGVGPTSMGIAQYVS